MPPAICDSEDEESDLEISIVPTRQIVGNNRASVSAVNPHRDISPHASSRRHTKESSNPSREAQNHSAQTIAPSAKRRKITHEHSTTALLVANDQLPSPNLDTHYEQGVTQFNRLPMVSQNYVTQPSPVITPAYHSAGLHRDQDFIPTLPQEDVWLQGTIQQDFEQHNPFMFTEASSTVPNDTAPELLYHFNSQTLDSPQNPQALNFPEQSPAKSSSNDPASIPWSAYLNSQGPKSSDNKGGQDPTRPTSSSNQSQLVVELRPGNVVAMSNADRLSESAKGKTTPVKKSVDAEFVTDIWAMPDSPDVLAPAAEAGRNSRSHRSVEKQGPALDPKDMFLGELLEAARGSAEDGVKDTSTLETTQSHKKRKKSEPKPPASVKTTSLASSSHREVTRNLNIQSLAGEEKPEAKASGRRESKRRKTAPSSESIAQLQAMGFEADQADQALMQVGGDLSRAIELLVGQQAELPDEITQKTDAPSTEHLSGKKRKKARAASPSVKIVSYSKPRSKGRSRAVVDEDEDANVEPAMFSGPVTKVKEPIDITSDVISDEKSDGANDEGRQDLAATPAPKVEPKKRGRGRPRKEATAPKQEAMELKDDVKISSEPDGDQESKSVSSAPKFLPKSETADDTVEADKENQYLSHKGPDNTELAIVPKCDLDKLPDIKTPSKGKEAAEKTAKSTGKAKYRVGLSRTARIAPLLRVMRK